MHACSTAVMVASSEEILRADKGLADSSGRKSRACWRAYRGTRLICFIDSKFGYAYRGEASARCFWRAGCALLIRGPLGGGEAGTIRPHSGRCHGGQRLFARAGARSKSPAPPHGLAVHGWTESANRGVVSSWLLLLWTSKGEVTRAPAGARNRFVSGEARGEAPLPQPLSRKRERGGSESSPASGRGEEVRLSR